MLSNSKTGLFNFTILENIQITEGSGKSTPNAVVDWTTDVVL